MKVVSRWGKGLYEGVVAPTETWLLGAAERRGLSVFVIKCLRRIV